MDGWMDAITCGQSVLYFWMAPATKLIIIVIIVVKHEQT